MPGELFETVNGVTYALGDAAQVRAIYDRVRNDPAWRLIWGCTGCKQICVMGVTDCSCCVLYARAGVSFRETVKTHTHAPVFEVPDFVARVERRGAA